MKLQRKATGPDADAIFMKESLGKQQDRLGKDTDLAGKKGMMSRRSDDKFFTLKDPSRYPIVLNT